MPLSFVDQKRLKRAIPVLIRDGDVREIVSGLYGTVFDKHDREIILNESSPNDRMIKLVDVYETNASSLEPLHSVLIEFTLQPHIASQFSVESQRSTIDSPPINIEPSTNPVINNFLSQLRLFYDTHFSTFKPIAQMDLSFSVESTWIKLCLDSDSDTSDDYQTILSRELSSECPVIIAGDPGIGKTTLTKKLCYDWTHGSFSQYDAVFCARLREVPEATSVMGAALTWLERKMPGADWPEVRLLLEHAEMKILVILDALDESVCNCSELDELLFSIDGLTTPYDLILTSRPYKTHDILAPHQKVTILGFTEQQQMDYIDKHFARDTKGEAIVLRIKQALKVNPQIQEIIRIPLILSYFCIAFDHLTCADQLSELYEVVIGCLINRYQTLKHPKCNHCFGKSWRNSEVIKKLSSMGLDGLLSENVSAQSIFTEVDLEKYGLDEKLLTDVGLLNMEHEFSPIHGEIKKYTFCHKTMQEFFAAFYLFLLCTATEKAEIWKPTQILSKMDEGNSTLPQPLKRVLAFFNPWELVDVFQFLLELADRSENEITINHVLAIFLARWSKHIADPFSQASLSVYVEDFWRKLDFRTFYSLKEKCRSDEIRDQLSDLLSSLLRSHSNYHIKRYMQTQESRENILRLQKNVYFFRKLSSMVSSPHVELTMRKYSSGDAEGANELPVDSVFCNFTNLAEIHQFLIGFHQLNYMRVHIDEALLVDTASIPMVPKLPVKVKALELCMGDHRVEKGAVNDSSPVLTPFFLKPAAQQLLSQTDDVQKLILYGSQHQVADLPWVIQETVLSKTLSRLVLARLKLSSRTLDEFCQTMKYWVHLTWLEIAYCNFGNTALLQITKSCTENKLAFYVLLGETTLRDQQTFERFGKILVGWHSLIHLGLNSHMLTKESVETLALDVLPKMKSLQRLQINSNLISHGQKMKLEKANSKVIVLL